MQNNVQIVQQDELSFFNFFQNETLHHFSESSPFICDENTYLVLIDQQHLIFSILSFNKEKTICSYFFSKETRKDLNTSDIIADLQRSPSSLEKLSDYNDIGLLFHDIDFLIEEETNILKKDDFIEKRNNLLNKQLSFSYEKQENLHYNTQNIVKRLGDMFDYKTWIAYNDKSRLSKGEELGVNTIKNFPKFNVPKETLHTFELIDAIWFEEERPTHCFEVETSTSIYSALLRFADLSISLPHYGINYYILIPKKRLKKALHELSRPSIKSLCIADFTSVIFIEDLEVLFQKINGLEGYILPNVLEKISYNVNELEFLKNNIGGEVLV